MPIEMRYRGGRYVVDGTRGRDGLADATMRLVPPSPVPQVNPEQAVRRIASIRRGQLGLIGIVGAATAPRCPARGSVYRGQAIREAPPRV